MLLDAVPLEGQEYLIVHAGADRNSINRFILTSGVERRTTPQLNRLNSATVKAEPESGSGSVVGSGNMVAFSVPGFNLINGSYAYDSSRGLIVEAERTLNTMNIFSADGTYARTVCTYGQGWLSGPRLTRTLSQSCIGSGNPRSSNTYACSAMMENRLPKYLCLREAFSTIWTFPADASMF